MTDQQVTGALDGVRVLDFTQMMLGPFATQYLGDLGADVIKVERPGVGEWERGLEIGGRLQNGTSAAFLAMNRNKRSIAVDLKAPGATELLLDLASTCDVVVENFRPGVMDRLGLGYEAMRSVKPDIIYCSGSGWGQDTKYARENRPGQDILVQAMSGLAANAGRAGDAPVIAGSSLSDATTALTLTNGILAALFARERHGIGQRVEVDLFHSTIAVMCQEIAAMLNQQQDFDRSAAGVAQPWLSAPYGVYAVTDGWVAVAMGSADRLAKALDEPTLAETDLWQERDEVKRHVDTLVADLSTDELVQRLLDHGLWAAHVRTMREAVDELRADGSPLLISMEDPTGQPLQLVGCPVTLSETPWQARLGPPQVGEHTDEVLRELVDDEQLAAYRRNGVVA
jgi:crotonobetainyl-CoA:carnitine CoA-transferase CaiB-like acyl-CoA transferase